MKNIYLNKMNKTILLTSYLTFISLSHAADVFPKSEMSYPGASSSRMFIATEPYNLNIMGNIVQENLLAKPRAFDFGGDIPFVNPMSGASDPAVIQGWLPPAGVTNLSNTTITNKGLPGRIEKRNGTLMVRYLAKDGMVGGRARASLVSYAIPPRTHVRWELEVAFGAQDGENEWKLTPNGDSPVLFWQVKSPNAGTPAMQADVDTDPKDPTKLKIKFLKKAGLDPVLKLIGEISNIPRYQMTSIVIEAFLDERETANGGKGRVQVKVNGAIVGDLTGPTLNLGPNVHYYYASSYSFNEMVPSADTRATFWNATRMFVYP